MVEGVRVGAGSVQISATSLLRGSRALGGARRATGVAGAASPSDRAALAVAKLRGLPSALPSLAAAAGPRSSPVPVPVPPSRSICASAVIHAW